VKKKKKEELRKYREREESERVRAALASNGKRKTRPIIICIFVVVAFFALLIYHNSPADSSASPTAQNLITETSDTTPAREDRPSAKCQDGSALTVTSRDVNQTNYRCESGAVGAYTNIAEGE
jgi:hypothetical protein